MPIPDYQTLMLSVLRAVADGQEYRFRNVVETLADAYQLTDEERNTLLPSGTAPLFDNRVGWARTYLKQAGVVESRKRGYFNITERGKSLLAQNPDRIDNSTLDQYPEFIAFRQKKTSEVQATIVPASQLDVPTAEVAESTPEESFAQAYERLRINLETELLDQVRSSTPSFFERLVIDLLVAMGYGGSRQDAGSVIGRSGDGGIDGTIKEDKLGLDVIYVQAKRWEDTVGRPEIQKFAGALQGQRANKGVFITTSTFTRDAKDYAGVIASKIILVDGDQLVKLMVDHNVGVSTISTFHIKKIDSDYFEGDAV
ncbi:restriction endonuclease [Paraburkholderia sp. 22099]|jgi:restriction system protein|uniref:restriction endonuclease n=1 Tax=Paraburkholderia TaxID=1822464 RepID=UPI00286056F8|nr:restriction endonuclease [Paraburkholderia terricola]MDR6491868.1 restriction system protein [Paraburkholderia terricola]